MPFVCTYSIVHQEGMEIDVIMSYISLTSPSIFLAICRVRCIVAHMCVICLVQTNGLAQLHIHNNSKWHKATLKHMGLPIKHDEMDFVYDVYSFPISLFPSM
jgi:hypothetical protein